VFLTIAPTAEKFTKIHNTFQCIIVIAFYFCTHCTVKTKPYKSRQSYCLTHVALCHWILQTSPIPFGIMPLPITLLAVTVSKKTWELMKTWHKVKLTIRQNYKTQKNDNKQKKCLRWLLPAEIMNSRHSFCQQNMIAKMKKICLLYKIHKIKPELTCQYANPSCCQMLQRWMVGIKKFRSS